ncbi:hypothetical protein C900_04251 [Fulvivirga imtechensis AK7]|uniref:Lipocalin-like domain-containing protein n=1 Tax=Fulvivirga imtechensis AK7 TaxID=1237149 RepID=L8K0D7_9BACT|nr:lipocalin family protein [Fulvivirga imtechensis]ELR73399.1 hypothetical protein C900_04251 [Fulvivirga imtechensis AK7]
MNFLKRRSLWGMLLVLLVAVTTLGCKNDDDDDEVSTEKLLIGTWTALGVERVNCTSADDNGTVTLDCPDFCLVLTVNSDGTYEDVYTDSGDITTTTGKYTVSGDTITICDDHDADCTSVTFTLSGDTLVITNLEEDSGCDVVLTYTRN